jgi:hypothetical protein
VYDRLIGYEKKRQSKLAQAKLKVRLKKIISDIKKIQEEQKELSTSVNKSASKNRAKNFG